MYLNEAQHAALIYSDLLPDGSLDGQMSLDSLVISSSAGNEASHRSERNLIRFGRHSKSWWSLVASISGKLSVFYYW